jgi:class 3 adenylate cyclase
VKRVTYVSSATRKISQAELDQISTISSSNNAQVGVTGVLLLCGDFFFQILEGEELAVDTVLERIRRDERHCDIQILKVEKFQENRQFADWSMRTVYLDAINDTLVMAIRLILANLAESRSILERYTQPAVLDFLFNGTNPLETSLQTESKVVLFGDIAAFDALSSFYSTEEVADHASCFLEVLSNAVGRHGGQVNKYIGDKVLAYFAPEQADDAVLCCVESLSEIRALRQNAAQCRLRNFLYGGFGLAMGDVIVGNFGSSMKLDYTILGNTVNIAARIVSITRSTGRALMLEETVKNACQRSWQWDLLGEYQLKGQMGDSKCFSLKDELVKDTRTIDEMIKQVLGTTEEHRRNCLC